MVLVVGDEQPAREIDASVEGWSSWPGPLPKVPASRCEAAAGGETLDAVVAIVDHEDGVLARRVDPQSRGDEVELAGPAARAGEHRGGPVGEAVGAEVEALDAVVVLVGDVEFAAGECQPAVDARVQFAWCAAERSELALEVAAGWRSVRRAS